MSDLTIAQLPTYNLRVLNINYYGCPSNILEFDIYLEQTNYPTEFRYNAGQYLFNFNSEIANGGTLIYEIVGSELPQVLRPWNPQVIGTQLRLASNNPGGASNSYLIPNTGAPGIKVVRMRLLTTASSFANVPLNLEFRNSTHGNPYTKISAYTEEGGIDITTDSTHSVDQLNTATCDAFLLNTPKFSSASNPSPVSFSWHPVLNAMSYTLQVAADMNFNNIIKADSGIYDPYHEFDSLSSGAVYFWRVLAKDETGNYLTSQTWSFNTGFSGGPVKPAYDLTARDFVLNEPVGNQLEFDIYVYHTNPPVLFEYSLGQYYFEVNDSIANGGTLTYEILSSELPLQFQPVSAGVEGNKLMLSANVQPPGPGFGLNLTGNSYPGTRIAKVRLTTSASRFANVPLDLVWRNNPQEYPCTKIYAYAGQQPQQLFTNITTPATHTVSENIILPVELSEFSYTVDRNVVTLMWTTSAELNNCCFDIERASIFPGSTNGNLNFEKTGSVTGSGTTNVSTDYIFSERLATGKYAYRIKQIDFNHNFEYFYLSNDVEVGVPGKFQISQNYPNPFNPETAFDFELPYDSHVNITVYDAIGNVVSTILDENKTAGLYTTHFNASGISSGIYFYKFIAGGFSQVRKMMVIK